MYGRIDEKDTFGYKLVCIRKFLNMPREELAKNVCISASTIGRYENNQTIPDCCSLTLFAKEFGCSPGMFLFSPRVSPDDLLPDAYTMDKEEFRKVVDDYFKTYLNMD